MRNAVCPNPFGKLRIFLLPVCTWRSGRSRLETDNSLLFDTSTGEEERKLEEASRQAGWKQIPDCAYFEVGKGGRLICRYRYDSERLELSKAIGRSVMGVEDDREKGDGTKVDLSQECSARLCPFRMRL
jgi:hypothetical protein